MTRGWFPMCLKDAKVYLLQKSGDTMNKKNYRLIAILPAISNLFEKIMYERIYSYCVENNMFSWKQFGFRSMRSTNDALVEIAEQTTKGSTDKFTCILLDLRKAFDSINDETLLAELEKNGVRGKCFKWFESYLGEQHECAQVDDALSDYSYLMVRVPQSLFLGPLMFLIYQ